jgi:hypothetical protein
MLPKKHLCGDEKEKKIKMKGIATKITSRGSLKLCFQKGRNLINMY